MFWPFKKKKVHYPGNHAEAVALMYNKYLVEWFEENPNIKDFMKARMPDFNECNILHNMCAINMMLSFKINGLEKQLKELKRIQGKHRCK